MTNVDYARILKELVEKIRNKLQDPDQSELKSPLQIILIWFKNTKNNIQFLLFKHNKRFADKRCDVLGPYEIYRRDVLKVISADIRKGDVFKSLVDKDGLLVDELRREIRIKTPYLRKEDNNIIINE